VALGLNLFFILVEIVYGDTLFDDVLRFPVLRVMRVGINGLFF